MDLLGANSKTAIAAYQLPDDSVAFHYRLPTIRKAVEGQPTGWPIPRKEKTIKTGLVEVAPCQNISFSEN